MEPMEKYKQAFNVLHPNVIKLDIQKFAEYVPTASTQIYEKQFRELLQAVFANRAFFSDFFGGGIQAIEGVANNATAFSVKTNDMPVVIQDYNTGENVAFETGTDNSSRFGPRHEVIYLDEDVPYAWTWAIHEGIDRFTVNADFDVAVADRLDAQAQAKMLQFNTKHAAFIDASAGHTETLAAVTDEALLELFNNLSKYFTNKQTVGTKVAKVTPDVHNAIVDHAKATTGKNSSANIDSNSILMFKGFQIEELPETAFVGDSVVYAYVVGVGRAFTGINTARTIEHPDFDGVALQGAGKAGEWIPEANKAAVVKVTGPAEVPAG